MAVSKNQRVRLVQDRAQSALRAVAQFASVAGQVGHIWQISGPWGYSMCSDKPYEEKDAISHWIGLRENLQEMMVLTIKYRAFL